MDSLNNLCCACKGYYGTSFGEPICPTCHAFLFYNRIKFLKPQIGSGIECLPPEMLLTIFSYLDDMSLWSAANVCQEWKLLIATHVTEDSWKEYTKKRWPLFKPLFTVDNWFEMYTTLTESAPCKICVANMCNENKGKDEDSQRTITLRNEWKILKTDPIEGIKLAPLDIGWYHWQGTIAGPVGSPFEGGMFFLHIQVPYSYPRSSAIVRFLTKIFHPNISRHGDVGIDSIEHGWTGQPLSIILQSIQSLLIDPCCLDVCMEPEIGMLYFRDKASYENMARAWTWKYAMHHA